MVEDNKMAKRYIVHFGKYFAALVSNMIREKQDLIFLLLETIKLFQIGDVIEESEKDGSVIIYVDRMSRVVYEVSDKIFSFNFPFYIKKNEESDDKYIIIDLETGIVFDEIITSTLLSIVRAKVLEKSSLVAIYDQLEDVANTFDITHIDSPNLDNADILWNLLKKLILFECCYLRFDHDEENIDGHLHPVNHIDVSYCDAGKFKLGLTARLNIEAFIDILNDKTECYYLESVRSQ